MQFIQLSGDVDPSVVENNPAEQRAQILCNEAPNDVKYLPISHLLHSKDPMTDE